MSIQFSLESQPQYQSQEGKVLRFTARNVGDKPAAFLPWFTPLDDVWSDCLDVSRNGEPIAYDGPLVKRAEPTSGDYVTLAPGEEIHRDFDLNEAYQVSIPSTYTVRVVSDSAEAETRFEVVEGDLSVSAVEAMGFRRLTLGESARAMEGAINAAAPAATSGPIAPAFRGGTSEERKTVEGAH